MCAQRAEVVKLLRGTGGEDEGEGIVSGRVVEAEIGIVIGDGKWHKRRASRIRQRRRWGDRVVGVGGFKINDDADVDVVEDSMEGFGGKNESGGGEGLGG